VRGFQSGKLSFEVYVDSKMIYSKHKEGYFPDFDSLIDEIEKSVNDKDYEVRYVSDTESCCTFRYTSCCQIS